MEERNRNGTEQKRNEMTTLTAPSARMRDRNYSDMTTISNQYNIMTIISITNKIQTQP